MPVVLGRDNILRCPVDSPSGDATLSFKVWFRGPVSNPDGVVARLLTMRGHVQYFRSDKKMWIGSMDGDLTIADLTLDDVGFYTCHFTGSKPRTLKLYIRGLFKRSFQDILSIRNITSNDD